MSETRDVLVYLTAGEVARWKDAYLQADDSTLLIRQRLPDQPAAWTTTAVYAPGTYTMACYADEQ